jgi:hypothetical protein
MTGIAAKSSTPFDPVQTGCEIDSTYEKYVTSKKQAAENCEALIQMLRDAEPFRRSRSGIDVW